jgi:hypothetical protein
MALCADDKAPIERSAASTHADCSQRATAALVEFGDGPVRDWRSRGVAARMEAAEFTSAADAHRSIDPVVADGRAAAERTGAKVK